MFHTSRKSYSLRLFLYSKQLDLLVFSLIFDHVSRNVKHL